MDFLPDRSDVNEEKEILNETGPGKIENVYLPPPQDKQKERNEIGEIIYPAPEDMEQEEDNLMSLLHEEGNIEKETLKEAILGDKIENDEDLMAFLDEILIEDKKEKKKEKK